MSNPFEDINVKKAAISLQEKSSDGLLLKKKRGRPRRPNICKRLLCLDKILSAMADTRAEELSVSTSFIVNDALRNYFK